MSLSNTPALPATEFEVLADQYRQEFPSQDPITDHLRRLLAYSALRQRMLEEAQIKLLRTCELGDKALSMIERLRAAAERSYYRALKQLKALLQNEPKSVPAPLLDFDKTNPMPTIEELRKQFPHADRNQLAKMRAGMPVRA